MVDAVEICTVGVPNRAYFVLGTGVQEAGREGIGTRSYQPRPDYNQLAKFAKENGASAVIIVGEAISQGVEPGTGPERYQTLVHLIRYQ